MKPMFNLLGLFNNLSGIDTNNKTPDIDEAVEHVIDGVDTKLRLVPGYRKKLRDEISLSLLYINSLVDQIPGPVEVNRKTFISDPAVRAYFATPDDLQDIFGRCSELAAYFSSNNHNECCAMLCANKEEKITLGLDLNDGVLQRDVKQTVINFFDHKVLSPGLSDTEVRQAIKMCIFDGLITYALQQIACIKIKRRDLKNEYRILNAKLRSRQAHGNGLSTMLAEASRSKEESAEIKAQIAEAENALNTMLGKKDLYAFYLEEIRRIFASPEKFIQLNNVCLRLTDMGVEVTNDSPKAAHEVYFSELEIVNVLKRVVTIVHYCKEDFNKPVFHSC